jgi:hypothetical protein
LKREAHSSLQENAGACLFMLADINAFTSGSSPEANVEMASLPADNIATTLRLISYRGTAP